MSFAIHDEDVRTLVRVLGTLGTDARCNLRVEADSPWLYVEATDGEARVVHRQEAKKPGVGEVSIDVRSLVQAIGTGAEACSLSVKGPRLRAAGTIDAWKPLLAERVELMLPSDDDVPGPSQGGTAADWLPALAWVANLPAKLKASGSVGECAWWSQGAIFSATGMVMHSVAAPLRNDGLPLPLPWRLAKLPIAADAPVVLSWRNGHLRVSTGPTTWWLPLPNEKAPEVAAMISKLTFGTEATVDALAFLDLVRQVEHLVVDAAAVPVELFARGGRLRVSVPDQYEGGGSGDIAAEITGPEDTTKWYGFTHLVPALRPYAEGKGKVVVRFPTPDAIGSGVTMLRDGAHTTLIAGRNP